MYPFNKANIVDEIPKLTIIPPVLVKKPEPEPAPVARNCIPKEDVIKNNNDHVISFDGKMLGLSSSVKELGGSIIYTVPITGGTPKQVTSRGPSYLHGWSPDGKDMVFCGERNGEYDVYKIPAAGGPEVRLTSSTGLDDGPE